MISLFHDFFQTALSSQNCRAKAAIQKPPSLRKDVAEHVGQLRISLSGTPVENKLQDLHSQFEFILPGTLA